MTDQTAEQQVDRALAQVRELLDIEEISSLKGRALRYLDTEQWEKWYALFTDDVRILWPDFDIDVDGREQLIEAWQRTVVPSYPQLSTHHGHMPEIEIIDDTTARALWAMENDLQWAQESFNGILKLHGSGHHIDEYRKVEGVWRISSMKQSQIHVLKVTCERQIQPEAAA